MTAVFLAMDFRLQIEVNYEADGMIFRVSPWYFYIDNIIIFKYRFLLFCLSPTFFLQDEVDSLASGDEEEEDFDGSTEDEISEGAQYNAIDDEDEENAARNQYVLGVQRISQNVSPFWSIKPNPFSLRRP